MLAETQPRSLTVIGILDHQVPIAEYLRLFAARRHRRTEYISAGSGRPSALPRGAWRGLGRDHERSGSRRGARRGHGRGRWAVPI